MHDPEAPQYNDAALASALQGHVSFSNRSLDTIRGRLAQRLSADRVRHLRYLRSRLPSIEDAEDAFQDTALKLLRHAASFTNTDNPDAWIGVALRNTVIDRYRRAAVQRRLSLALATAPPVSTEVDGDASLIPITCLNAALFGLKSEYAQILEQVYIVGDSITDIARDQEITVNNAAVRLHRARSALRKTIQRRCATCPSEVCGARQRPQPATARTTNASIVQR